MRILWKKFFCKRLYNQKVEIGPNSLIFELLIRLNSGITEAVLPF